ncbi:hypothetical protein RM530_18305, partial [Algiphilus sp. W345]
MDFSLLIEATGSQVPHQRLNSRHATSMPDAARPETGIRLAPPGALSIPGLDITSVFDTWSVVHFRSSQLLI